MSSTQFKNIQEMKKSLQLVQARIQKLAKTQYKNQITLSRLIYDTVPLMDKKLKQRQIFYQYQNKKSKIKLNKIDHFKKNQQSRIQNQKQISKSKQLIHLIKHHNSLHLRQISKKNQQKIKQKRDSQWKRKIQNKKKIQEQQKQSSKKIQVFHYFKKKDLKQYRQKMMQEQQQKYKKILQQFKKKSEEQQKMALKVKNTTDNIVRCRQLLNKVNVMKTSQFQNFKQNISIIQNDPLTLSQAALLTVLQTKQ